MDGNRQCIVSQYIRSIARGKMEVMQNLKWSLSEISTMLALVSDTLLPYSHACSEYPVRLSGG
jgi:hypothetical protein